MDSTTRFIIIGSNWDIYRLAFSSLISTKRAEYFSDSKEKLGMMLNLLYKFHTSRTINKVLRIPFKSIWNRLLFSFDCDSDSTLYFVIFGRWHDMNLDIHLSEFLRRKYKGCKLIWFLQDLYIKQKTYYDHMPFNIEKEHQLYDLIISYDRGDCTKYGFKYHPTVYTPLSLPEREGIEPCDVYFLGKGKGRQDYIVNIYRQLVNQGLSCSFFIYEPDRAVDKSDEGIVVLETSFSYMDNLAHIKKTKCILEVMQEGAVGYTFRLWEAIAYDKKIITNNTGLINESFYDSDRMLVIKDNKSICGVSDFINNDNLTDCLNKDFILPCGLLDFIEANV